jgi:hypothetical protein
MECNDLPQLDETTDAIAGRLNVTPFKSRFLLEHIYNDLTEEEKKAVCVIWLIHIILVMSFKIYTNKH